MFFYAKFWGTIDETIEMTIRENAGSFDESFRRKSIDRMENR